MNSREISVKERNCVHTFHVFPQCVLVRNQLCLRILYIFHLSVDIVCDKPLISLVKQSLEASLSHLIPGHGSRNFLSVLYLEFVNCLDV